MSRSRTRRPTLDSKLHEMIRDLGRAISEAISESAEVNCALRRLRQEGYSLYLLVKEETSEPVSRKPSSSPPRGEPVFRIDGRDLSFLRSIGIDPTRQLRRRRA